MIRNLKNSDISFLVDGFNTFNIIKKKEDFFDNNVYKYLIYEYNNIPIGFLDYSLYYDRLEINYIYMDFKYRKKGYGSELLNYFIDLYKNKNIINITLEVAKSNTAAIKLYKNEGFKIVAIRQRYYSNHEDAYLMERKY